MLNAHIRFEKTQSYLQADLLADKSKSWTGVYPLYLFLFVYFFEKPPEVYLSGDVEKA